MAFKTSITIADFKYKLQMLIEINWNKITWEVFHRFIRLCEEDTDALRKKLDIWG